MRVMVVLIILILLTFGFALFWPTDNTSSDHVSSEHVASEKNTASITSGAQAVDDERVVLMKLEYKTLEEARKTLTQRLGRLKHELWGLKFSSNDAKQMNEVMLSAYKLIKNPDMLGAFSNVKEIQIENTKLNFANNALDAVDEMIKAHQKQE